MNSKPHRGQGRITIVNILAKMSQQGIEIVSFLTRHHFGISVEEVEIVVLVR